MDNGSKLKEELYTSLDDSLQDYFGLKIDDIDDDELVEVTPKSIRVRKRFLTENERKRASRLPKENKE